MSTLRGYRRTNQSVGIRNHLFALPAVVCANQVALDLARTNPRLKYIEHQHGCAQIGQDLTQTRQVFARLALHPNVFASMLIGLGCEGIVSKDLHQQAQVQGLTPVDLVVIQEAGGTLGAQRMVQSWVQRCGHEADNHQREVISWTDLLIGVMVDTDTDTDNASLLIAKSLKALRDTGARLVVSEECRHLATASGWPVATLNQPHVAETSYGEAAVGPITVMASGSNALETMTGLTSAGAHLILHFASLPHAFGSPLAPTVRWCVNEQCYLQFADDFDGRLRDELDVARLLEQVSRVICGQVTKAEELGMDDFAMYRIGPTV
ncbi:UxaA family hydrolase [Alicyclobacillus curvatus]|nr:UxaA family hydrolase [Alicyclobacillus curvatus]